MDEYTHKTKHWLDQRFQLCNEQGIYFAHQPIYGFRQGHCDPGHLLQYISTYNIMNVLSHIQFNSFLDVGAAEGYTAYIVQQLFDVKVKTSDLSEQACLRAQEIFDLESSPGDIHNLPYKDNEFDVLLCSASLEHVSDYKKAINELSRVAAKAVIITVPNERPGVVKRNIEEQVPHGHIHSFELDSFDFLKQDGYDVLSKRICSRLFMFLDNLIEPYSKDQIHGILKYLRIIINSVFVPIWKILYGVKLASLMIYLDRLMLDHYLILFILLKDKTCYSPRQFRKVPLSQIMNITVPYHYLNK